MSLSVVILAAGKGNRMHSSLPKVMHTLAGKSLLEHVFLAVSMLPDHEIYVVYGHGGDKLRQSHAALDVRWVEQARQLGTGHAVVQVIDTIPDDNHVLVLYGDVPLITEQTLKKLVAAADETGFSLLTSHIEDPTGYGRIIRDDAGNILRIVEEKDDDDREKSICEINTGMMVVRAVQMKKWLGMLVDDNAQKEYLLTDIVRHAVKEKVGVRSVSPTSVMEIKGVNDRVQLSVLERHYQLTRATELMRQGVTLADPTRFDLRGSLETGKDVFMDVNVVIEGEVSIGNNVSIGPNCVIRDTRIGADVSISANCVIDNAVVGERNKIGPFARIRPGSRLAEDVHIGNFVEIKATEMGQGSKANHLSYIGDSEVGERVNVGAGAITCNYDGVDKHKTIIGNDVFIGSNTELIAPLKINDGATIAAGATVSKDVEADSLAMNKRESKIVKGWKRSRKKKGSE